MKSTISIGLLIAFILTAGCQNVGKAISHYYSVANQVQIGDSKEKTLAILQPTQETLSLRNRKPPEMYEKDGKRVEIYFFRSAIQQSDILTDDEFMPYVFENGKLVAIGWAYLGGPKTQAHPQPIQRIEVYR